MPIDHGLGVLLERLFAFLPRLASLGAHIKNNMKMKLILNIVELYLGLSWAKTFELTDLNLKIIRFLFIFSANL